jgi:hypothetical protein
LFACFAARLPDSPKDTPMADYPTECPVCNAVAFAVHEEDRHCQHETPVHSASFESYHCSTTFHFRCHECGNQWATTMPAQLWLRQPAAHAERSGAA